MSEYLIWSNEHGAWWCPNSLGYTNDRDQAGRYERADAIAICRRALIGSASGIPNEIPVREEDVAGMFVGDDYD